MRGRRVHFNLTNLAEPQSIACFKCNINLMVWLMTRTRKLSGDKGGEVLRDRVLSPLGLPLVDGVVEDATEPSPAAPGKSWLALESCCFCRCGF